MCWPQVKKPTSWCTGLWLTFGALFSRLQDAKCITGSKRVMQDKELSVQDIDRLPRKNLKMESILKQLEQPQFCHKEKDNVFVLILLISGSFTAQQVTTSRTWEPSRSYKMRIAVIQNSNEPSFFLSAPCMKASQNIRLGPHRSPCQWQWREPRMLECVMGLRWLATLQKPSKSILHLFANVGEDMSVQPKATQKHPKASSYNIMRQSAYSGKTHDLCCDFQAL